MKRPDLGAVAMALGFFLVFYAAYAGAAVLSDDLPHRYRLFFAWEPSIPLWPWTVLVYTSLNWMLIPLLLTFPTSRQLWPVVLTLSFELGVALCIFFLIPLEDGFNDPPLVGPMATALAWAKTAALRHNYFPSLHVTLAFTAASTVASRSSTSQSAGLYVWASLIALSTLTTHSHHLIDVVGGILLAWLGYHLVFRRRV